MRVRVTLLESSRPYTREKLEGGGAYEATPGGHGYWVEGEMLAEPQEGYPFVVYREIRNGVERVGLFRTSPVQKLVVLDRATGVGWELRTENSTYQVLEVTDET